MSITSLIFALIIVLISLLFIDIIRKAKRQKQKKILEEIEKKHKSFDFTGSKSSETSKEEISFEEKESDITKKNIVEDVTPKQYPNLEEGFALFYFETNSKYSIKELNSFLSEYNLRRSNGVFQLLNYRDVIYTVIPDNEEQSFDNLNNEFNLPLIIVMNFKKVKSLGYNSKECYENMLDMLDNMSDKFNGIIMNENNLRLTKIDKEKYLEKITKY